MPGEIGLPRLPSLKSIKGNCFVVELSKCLYIGDEIPFRSLLQLLEIGVCLGMPYSLPPCSRLASMLARHRRPKKTETRFEFGKRWKRVGYLILRRRSASGRRGNAHQLGSGKATTYVRNCTSAYPAAPTTAHNIAIPSAPISVSR